MLSSFTSSSRPLVVLNHGVNSMERLQTVSLIRVGLCALFVLYALVPRESSSTTSGSSGLAVSMIPTSDSLAITLAALLFGGSGFLSILAYALAASSLQGSAERAYSGALLNQCFQASMFSAVIASELIALLLPKGDC